MHHPLLRRVLSGVAILAVLVAAAPALAQAVEGIPTTVTAVSRAPLAITSCKIGRNIGPYGDAVNAVVVNRTSHGVLAVGVQIRYYDQDGTLIGQASPVRNLNEPLAGGDNAVLQFSSGANLSEPVMAIVRATCRLQSAVFTGRKRWTYGQNWTGKLPPLPTAQNGAGEREVGRNTSATTMRPRVRIAVTNAWFDVVRGVPFIHDTVTIVGGDADTRSAPRISCSPWHSAAARASRTSA